ncbi:MAG: phosphate ABC transporter substrate-binding protein, partial [Hyphomicrobiaceae bacterium]|nr:phosphate ABC transporter substrate-binding protein [Hyphomicrobiaceae bacterium]
IYFKKAHVGVTPGLDKFMAEYVSDKALGTEGYLARKGLVTLPKDQLAAERKNVTDKVSLDGSKLN